MKCQNVVLDTCVVFNILKYSHLYETQGEAAFYNYLNQKKQDMLATEEQIKQYLPNSLKNKTGEPFEKTVRLYMVNLNGTIGKLKREAGKYRTMLEQGIYYKNGQVIPVTLTSEERKELEQEYKNKTALLKKLRQKYGAINKLLYGEKGKKGYFDKIDRTQPGILFEKYLKGELKFHVVKTSYKEILNHIDGLGNAKHKIDPKMIYPFLKRCTLISTNSKEIETYIEQLAERFRRNAKSGAVEMAEDINSLNEYGDSKIMAEANLAGMPLVTANGKDFIYSSKDKTYDGIRRHINNVTQKFYPKTTSALAYTPGEIIAGAYNQNITASTMLKELPQGQAKNAEFADEITL